MNIPPVSIAAVKQALIAPYADPLLRRRASMRRGPRGVGKSSFVHQVAAHFGVPLVDLRLTTIEPVDIRGAIYADEDQAKTIWFPPELLPTAEQPDGILFLDEPTAADQGRQDGGESAERQQAAAGRSAPRPDGPRAARVRALGRQSPRDLVPSAGADFTPLLEEAERWRPDIGVFLTDLEGPADYRPRCPVLWAVRPGQAEAPHPFGRKLVLD